MARIIRQSLAIVIISTIIGFVVNLFHPHRVIISRCRPAIEYAADSISARDLPPVRVGVHDTLAIEGLETTDGPPVVDTRQVKELLDRGKAVALDARNTTEYKAGHIPGAIHLPFENLGEYADRLDSLPPNKWLITYCDGPPCDLGELLAYQLLAAGYTHVAIYQNGLNAWIKTEKVETGGS